MKTNSPKTKAGLNEVSICPKAQFLITAYQGLMLAIFLSVLIGHGEAL